MMACMGDGVNGRGVARMPNDAYCILIKSCYRADMPLNIFRCGKCGTHRIWGNGDLDKKHEEVPNDRPRNLSPLLRCEGVCDKDQIHTYAGDALDLGTTGKQLIDQSQQRYWITADAYRKMTGQDI